jgi:hypothetical protein
MQHFLSASDRLAGAVQLRQLRKEVVKRVCGLIKKMFLNRQPALPSASRWTGAAQAALWNAATLLFFGMQLALLTSMGWVPNVQASLPVASEANQDLLSLLLLMFILSLLMLFAALLQLLLLLLKAGSVFRHSNPGRPSHLRCGPAELVHVLPPGRPCPFIVLDVRRLQRASAPGPRLPLRQLI